jgi:hypothetical protein
MSTRFQVGNKIAHKVNTEKYSNAAQTAIPGSEQHGLVGVHNPLYKIKLFTISLTMSFDPLIKVSSWIPH